MSYTDLWRCKHCNTLPDITFLSGKRFLIACKVCNSSSTSIECGSIDEVVRRWNAKNDPRKLSIGGMVHSLVDFICGLWGYKRAQARERKAIQEQHLKELTEPAPVPTSAAMRQAMGDESAEAAQASDSEPSQ
jgi:hypothetical protein